MKYAETCECGVVLEVTSDDPMMFARVKGRWKLDHEGHSLNRLRSKRKKLVGEINQLNQLVDDLKLKAEDVQKQIDLGTPITPPASTHDYTQQLYDLSPGDVPFLKLKSDQQAAEMKKISDKSALERNFGDSVVGQVGVFPDGSDVSASTDPAYDIDKVMAAWHLAIKDKLPEETKNSEQGKQVQGEGDEGAATPKGNATSSRV